jgi:hypothetical protein
MEDTPLNYTNPLPSKLSPTSLKDHGPIIGPMWHCINMTVQTVQPSCYSKKKVSPSRVFISDFQKGECEDTISLYIIIPLNYTNPLPSKLSPTSLKDHMDP